jgi:hypothetical protein
MMSINSHVTGEVVNNLQMALGRIQIPRRLSGGPKASRALKKEDQIYGQRLAEMANMHSSEAFYALDDPQGMAIFSVLVELVKEIETRKEQEAKAA